MNESLVEYSALRDEIIRLQTSMSNEMVNMYLAFTALFALGFTYRWLFISTFILLTGFQAMINRDQWNITKISAFIKIFFEETNPDINWEHLHEFQEFRDVLKKENNEISFVISHWSAAILATFSLAALLVTTTEWTNGDIMLCGIALSLWGLTFITNRAYSEKKDTEMMKEKMRSYYVEVKCKGAKN